LDGRIDASGTSGTGFTAAGEIQRLGGLADQIETEMRGCGLWNANPPAEETVLARGAFGLEPGPFSDWVQVVFLPRIREAAEGKVVVAPASRAGAQAIQEWGDRPQFDILVSLLIEVDRFGDPSR